MQPPEESPASTRVDDPDAYAFDSDTFDEDSLDDVPVGDTVDMDEAETRARGGSWAFRHLEGVMMGAARPPRDGEDGVTRVTSSFDDDDEWYQHKPTLMAGHAGDSETDDERADAAESVAARAGDAGPFTPRSARFTLSAEEEDFSVSRSVPERDEASSTNRRGGWASWLRAAVPTWARAGLGARGWAAREKVRRRVAARRGREREARRLSEHPEKKETDSPARDWRAAAASWITDDDVETFFLSEPDPLGVGAFFHGVGTWAANRRERARAAAAAAAAPPRCRLCDSPTRTASGCVSGATRCTSCPCPTRGGPSRSCGTRRRQM